MTNEEKDDLRRLVKKISKPTPLARWKDESMFPCEAFEDTLTVEEETALRIVARREENGNGH